MSVFDLGLVFGFGVALLGSLGCGCSREDSQVATPTPSGPASSEPEISRRAESPESEPDVVEAEFVPATRGDGECIVTVSALLEAAEYRGGGPLTPALAAQLDADPEFARMYDAESHGDHHVECIYRVELDHEPGEHYRWRMWFSNTLRDKSPADCKSRAAEVAEDIIRTTQNCTDLDAGAYWGHVLEPM